jgi:hypothetical protein
MGSIIGLMVGRQLFGRTITEPVARFIAIAMLFLTLLGGCAGLVSCLKHKGATDYVQKVEHRAAPATTKAADERVKDAVTNAKNEEELHNAVHSVQDAAPAGPSHALACKRLSNVGKHPASCR